MNSSLMFSGAALNESVNRVLADSPIIPVGARGAFVTVANAQGVRAMIAVKVTDKWQVRAIVDHDWSESAIGEVAVSITGTF